MLAHVLIKAKADGNAARGWSCLCRARNMHIVLASLTFGHPCAADALETLRAGWAPSTDGPRSG